jgi:hypothetical protein
MDFERREVAIDFRLCRKAAFDQPLADVADEGARELPALVTRREGRRALSCLLDRHLPVPGLPPLAAGAFGFDVFRCFEASFFFAAGAALPPALVGFVAMLEPPSQQPPEAINPGALNWFPRRRRFSDLWRPAAC